MRDSENGRVLILGGAGFLGSHVVRSLVDSGYRVTVIDGLLPRTGGNLRNLEPVSGCIEFIGKRIEDVSDVSELLASVDAVVDCMGWTCHLQAIRDPFYDEDLNLRSHLEYLRSLPAGGGPKLIYLGSRGQYGRPTRASVAEDCPLEPLDIQGIHKTAAEHYFRLYARRSNVPAASLRVPACVGRNQPASWEDIGLFGGFARDLVNGREIAVYGSNRKRAVVDARDVAAIVTRVVGSQWHGFEAYNVPGHSVALAEAAARLRALAGNGSIRYEELPAEIVSIDIGDAATDCSKLERLIGEVRLSDLDEMFATMVDYFRKALLHDLAL